MAHEAITGCFVQPSTVVTDDGVSRWGVVGRARCWSARSSAVVSLTRKHHLLDWHHGPAGSNADAPEAERPGIRRGGELVCGVEETA